MNIEQQLPLVKKIEIEILEKVHTICTENNILYSLAYGTMIGAIRHKGFIPWDDDIDIFMLREEYEKFEKIWFKEKPNGFILENKDVNPDFPQCHTKIIKDKTVFLQEGLEEIKYHKGIFIDVFVLDRVADSKQKQNIQNMYAMLYFLYTRGFAFDRGSNIVKLGCRVLLGLVPKKNYSSVSKFFRKKLSKYNSHKDNALMCYCVMESLHKFYPSNSMDEMMIVPFENKEFMCSKKYDELLKSEYGDYMQLPPEEERTWKHHPVLIDFEHNYEELK